MVTWLKTENTVSGSNEGSLEISRGDELLLRFSDGTELTAEVMDSGAGTFEADCFELTFLHRMGVPIHEEGTEGSYALLTAEATAVPSVERPTMVSVRMAEFAPTRTGAKNGGPVAQATCVGMVRCSDDPSISAVVRPGQPPPSDLYVLLLWEPAPT